MKKKLPTALLAASLLMQSLSPALAASDIHVKVNGAQVDFPDAHPYINSDDRTMVPVRFISEQLGSKVSWNAQKRSVFIEYSGTTIFFFIGEKVLFKNGQEVPMDTAATIVNERAMVPLRAVIEAHNAQVSWDPNTRTVSISTPGYKPPAANPDPQPQGAFRTITITPNSNTITVADEQGKEEQITAANSPYYIRDTLMMDAGDIARTLGLRTEKKEYQFVKDTSISLKRKDSEGTYSTFAKIQLNRASFGAKLNSFADSYEIIAGPEALVPGQAIIPARAVYQALGCLYFPQADGSVIIRTWNTVPAPVASHDVQQVRLVKDQDSARVIHVNGEEKTVTTPHPTRITDPRNDGFTIDTQQFFELFGIPADNMLLDADHGGLIVKGTRSYALFYAGDNYAWHSDSTIMQNARSADGKEIISNENFFGANGRFYADYPTYNALIELYGMRFSWNKDGEEMVYTLGD